MRNKSYTYNLSVITITYSYLCTMKQSNLNELTIGGRKPLMSELLQDTREFIKLSEQADVEALRQFLFNDPELPLIAMGHGGSYSSAAFAALLYGTRCALGRAVTPFQANPFSDTTLRRTGPAVQGKHLHQSLQRAFPRFQPQRPRQSRRFRQEGIPQQCPLCQGTHSAWSPAIILGITFHLISKYYRTFAYEIEIL